MNTKNSNLKYFIGAGIVLAAVGFIFNNSLNNNLTFFVTPSEYLADQAKYQNKTVRLGGVVEPGSVHWNKENLELTFTLSDGTAKFPVSYVGAPPDLFQPGIGATVEGKFESKIFKGSQLLVKHSEEYSAPKPGEKLDYGWITKVIRESQ